MKTLKKIAIGCGALVAMAVLAVAGLWGLVQVQKAKWDKLAVPFIEAYLVELAHWEPERVATHWAPEVAAQFEPEKIDRLFLLYRQLGEMKSFDPPEFRQVGAHTGIPYPELVTYQVSAHFEAGPALITLQLVRAKSGAFKVWFLNVNSDAFLPQRPSSTEAQPSQPAP